MLKTKPQLEELKAKEWEEIIDELDELEELIPLTLERIEILRNRAAGLTGN